MNRKKGIWKFNCINTCLDGCIQSRLAVCFGDAQTIIPGVKWYDTGPATLLAPTVGES